jgi:hypothetical protein
MRQQHEEAERELLHEERERADVVVRKNQRLLGTPTAKASG